MLFKCPECGHDVSDKAVACPNCGWKVDVSELTEKSNAVKNPEPDSSESKSNSADSEPDSSDYQNVKIFIDNRNWGIAPSCSFYIGEKEVWRGKIGDTAELKLKGKTKVRFKSMGVPLLVLYGEFEGEIDPAEGTKYAMYVRGKNKHRLQFAVKPADFF